MMTMTKWIANSNQIQHFEKKIYLGFKGWILKPNIFSIYFCWSEIKTITENFL